MRFIKATLLTTNLLLLATSLYWTTTSWLHRTPTFSARPCTLLKKRIIRSKRLYRTEFLVTLHLQTSDAPALPPVKAFRYASPVYNQTLSQASVFLSRYKISANYTCFINAAKRVRHNTQTTPRRYDISMTYPSQASHAWVATLFSLVALVALLLQLVFIRVPVSVIPPSHVVTPPPRVGLSHERVCEVCVECSVDECAICLEDEGECKGARLPCGHAFHRSCLDRWLVRGRVCPLCNCDLGKVVVTGWKRVESKSAEQRQGDVGRRDGETGERTSSAEPNAGGNGEDGEMTGLSNVRRRKSSQRDTVELD